MARRFIVVARPRSRTSWLATFLNAAGAVCQHDIVDICAGPGAYREALNVADISGAVDTGAVFFLPDILVEIPGCHVAVIDRPRAECEEDMAKLGININMEAYDIPMERAKNLPEVLVVNYADLDAETTVRKLWCYLIGGQFPRLWYEHCRWMHIVPSKGFFNTEFIRRSRNPDAFRGWPIEHLIAAGG